MSNELISFDSESEALAWCAAIDAKLGYPNPATKTERYTVPLPGDDGRYYVPTNADCPASEITKIASAKRITPTDVKFDPDSGKVAEIKGMKLKAGK